MDDREKVVKGLECCIANRHNNCPYKSIDEGIDKVTTCTTYLMQDALALLKEQEPKQIVCKQGKNNFAEWYCPHCNMLILRGFNDPSIKFCYRCGKPILWESPVKWE